MSLEAAIDKALVDTGRIAPSDSSQVQHAGARHQPLPDGITAREREVAAPVGRGLSNRQIAQVLVVTDGTARVHVGRVLAKLDLHSRAQLAVWAVQHGLVEPCGVPS